MLIKRGNNIVAESGSACKLGTGVYTLNFDSNASRYYLVEASPLELPDKMYDLLAIRRRCGRWLSAFRRAKKNIGVLLTGLKGSGKTVTAQYLCLASNMPVILLTKPVENNDAFFEFMCSPDLRESVVFIDEFEKIFVPESVAAPGRVSNERCLPMLHLMDGNYMTRFLFVLTANGTIPDGFNNRLGRVRYRENYGTLSLRTVVKYLKDNLDEERQPQAADIAALVDKIGMSTYDILYHLVDELNHTKGAPLDVLCGLNVSYVEREFRAKVRMISPKKTGWLDAGSRRFNPYFGQTNVTVQHSEPAEYLKIMPERLLEFEDTLQLCEFNTLTNAGGSIIRGDFEIKFEVDNYVRGAFTGFGGLVIPRDTCNDDAVPNWRSV